MAPGTCLWNGFLHQGKVTLLYMIKTINDLITNDDSLSIPSYEIIIEGKEDFDVKVKDTITEFHQVKAYTTGNDVADFIDAIIHLNKNCDRSPTTSLYLHTVCQIDNWSESAFSEKIKNKIKRINDKEVKTEEDEKLLLSLDFDPPTYFNKVKLYPYSSNDFISLLEVNNTVVNEIKRYFQLQNQPHKIDESDKYYAALQCEISKKINEQHSIRKAPIPIKLNEIITILDDNNVLKRSENYHLNGLKSSFISLIQTKYCDMRCNYYENEDNQCLSCIITAISDIICNMSLTQFKDFLYKTDPTLCEINEKTANIIIEENGVVFLMKLIHRTLECPLNLSESEFYYSFNHLYYLPTVIIAESDLTPRGKNVLSKSIAENISNNNLIITELFRADKFITQSLNIDNIFETIIDGKGISSDEQANDITKNPIALISADKAKEELRQ